MRLKKRLYGNVSMSASLEGSGSLAAGTIVVLAVGQSNMVRWFSGDTRQISLNTFEIDVGGSEASVRATAPRIFGNILAEITGQKVIFVDAAAPASALLEENQKDGRGYWLTREAGSLYDNAATLMGNVGSIADIVLWAQGERDSGEYMTGYEAGLNQLFDWFAEDFGNPLIAIQEIYINLADVREIQESVAQNRSDTILGADTADASFNGKPHYDGASLAQYASEMAYNALWAWGYGGFVNETFDVLDGVGYGTDGRDYAKQIESEIFYGLGGDDLYIGGSEADVARGGQGSDVLRGLGGDDKIYGDSGNDVLGGDDGNDLLVGGGGTDEIWGGAGNDVLRGGGLSDLLYGAEGDDTIYGGGADDVLRGGIGDDVINGGGGFDIAYGDEGADKIKNAMLAYGGSGADIITGQLKGPSSLYGEEGFDTLTGGNRNDLLVGGEGNDVLIGGVGKDTMTGGSDADTFRFNSLLEFAGNSKDKADTITDFNSAEGDRINLKSLDAIEGGADDAFTFIGLGQFTGSAGELRYEHGGSNTFLSGDVNGDGMPDFMIRLDGLIALSAGDLVL